MTSNRRENVGPLWDISARKAGRERWWRGLLTEGTGTGAGSARHGTAGRSAMRRREGCRGVARRRGSGRGGGQGLCGTAENDFVRSRTIKGVRDIRGLGRTASSHRRQPGMMLSVASTTAGAMESCADSSSDP